MKTIKEMTEVMLAYEKGEQIQRSCIRLRDGWTDISEPEWNWEVFKYRVKSKSKTKFVPFETIEEFLKAQRKHGTILTGPQNIGYESSIDCYSHITLVNVYSEAVSNTSLENLFEKFKFQDGTPCGKEVEK